MSNLKIGITGGIGSGKSEISRYLMSMGEHVICADEVARLVVQPGEQGNHAIRCTFGEQYFLEDDTLDRKMLAKHVFSDQSNLALLNNILHPVIVEYILTQADSLSGRVFIDAPLLIQTGLHKETDFVWLVIADMKVRVKRVMMRDGISESDVKQRIASQMSDQEMAEFADEIIDNSGSIENLHQKIDSLLDQPVYSGVAE